MALLSFMLDGSIPPPMIVGNPDMSVSHRPKFPGTENHGKSHSGMWKPPFKFTDSVFIDTPIEGDGHHFRRRLLGPQAVNVKRIVQDSGGTNDTLRIRLRGIGSAYYEGIDHS